MASSSSSDISRRHDRRSKDKDSLKVRKKIRSSHGKKRKHLSSSSSQSYSSSSEDYSSSDSEHKTSHRSKRHKSSDKSKKNKDKGKSHRHRHHKYKSKEKKEEKSGPVQLSKFLGKDKDDGVRRSAVSGKKILLKLDKTKEDKLAENNRNELLKFLNSGYD